jgi:predicted house-cleaning NTP pyrophosphatase (Maf/HAM1 superfamily)
MCCRFKKISPKPQENSESVNLVSENSGNFRKFYTTKCYTNAENSEKLQKSVKIQKVRNIHENSATKLCENTIKTAQYKVSCVESVLLALKSN